MPYPPPIDRAIIEADRHALQELHRTGGYHIDHRDEDGNSLLLQALHHGADYVMHRDRTEGQLMKTALVKLLIELGADVNIKNYQGLTPIFCAIQFATLAEVKLLVENGADINVLMDSRISPVAFAEDCRKPEIVQFLTEYLKQQNISDYYNLPEKEHIWVDQQSYTGERALTSVEAKCIRDEGRGPDGREGYGRRRLYEILHIGTSGILVDIKVGDIVLCEDGLASGYGFRIIKVIKDLDEYDRAGGASSVKSVRARVFR